MSGDSYTVKRYYTPRTEITAKTITDSSITLYPGDVLTKDKKTGTYCKHTGIGMFGLKIDDKDLKFIKKPAQLVFM